MKKLYTLALVALSAIAVNAQDFTATYDFAGATTTSGTTDPSTVPTATGVTFGSFRVVNPNLAPTVTGTSGAGRFSFPNQPTGATNGDDVYANLTGSVDTGVYYQVVLTPAAGQALNLSQITFRGQRSGTGIRTYVVRSSVDNFATNLPVSIATNTNVSVQSGNVFFWTLDSFTQGVNANTVTLSNHNNISGPVTFRFYGYNAEAETGTFSIDDVVFTGNAAPLAGVKQNTIAGLKVYPNPLTGNVLNVTSDSNDVKAVAIFDVLGKQVVNTTTVNGEVNASNLTAGVYIVKITEAGKTATKKLVVR